MVGRRFGCCFTAALLRRRSSNTISLLLLPRRLASATLLLSGGHRLSSSIAGLVLVLEQQQQYYCSVGRRQSSGAAQTPVQAAQRQKIYNKRPPAHLPTLPRLLSVLGSAVYSCVSTCVADMSCSVKECRCPFSHAGRQARPLLQASGQCHAHKYPVNLAL